MRMRRTMPLLVMAAALMWLSGCGDDDAQGQECESACERVYATTSDGGCQQSFRFDGNRVSDESECVELCQQEESFMMNTEGCVADESAVDCQSQPSDMVNMCLSEMEVSVEACEHLEPWDSQAVQMENEVVELVNEVRAEGVVCEGTGQTMPEAPPVTMDPQLRCAARLHSVNMIETGEFDHQIGGEGPGDRAHTAGYNWSTVGENIAQGQQTPQAVVDAWLSSTSGHCENLMESGFENIGMGVKFQGSTPWWTQKFGTRQ